MRSTALQESVKPIIHHFLASNPQIASTSYKLQPGGPGYELVYSVTGVTSYLNSLTFAGTLQASFDAIAHYEQKLIEPLLSYLTDPKQQERGVRVVGEEQAGLGRVPTISFVVVGQKPIKSKDIVEVFDKKGGVSVSACKPSSIL